MLCSIIIPLYNKEKFIRFAIDSVLRQTFQNFEIVIIDDGSSDGSADIVNSIEDPRIRLISQTNGGVSRARNRGIKEAHGDLVLFLDADDWYDKDFVQTIVSMAKKHPEGTFFATNFKPVLEYRKEEWNQLTKPQTNFEIISDFYERRYHIGAFIHTNSVAAWHKDLAAMQPCFPEGESMGEDQDLLFKLLDRLKLVYCATPLIGYRYEVENGLVASTELRELPPVFLRLEQRARQGSLRGRERTYAQLLVADARVNVARALLVKNRRWAAFAELMRGMRGAVKKRWWVTLLMSMFGSPEMMRKWERFRFKKLHIQ